MELKEQEIIEKRKKEIVDFFKKNKTWIIYVVLIGLVILGVYIRYLPLTDHNGLSGLWDSTQNDYSLGPDLDPYLFLRYAKTIITEGSLPKLDSMRNVPLGFETSKELHITTYAIVLTYNLINLFGNYSINFAGAFMPVLLFALTILAFFFFVREIFLTNKSKEQLIKASIISLIATFFMIIIPAFLSRTVAGIPEKESVAFFFMFLSFYLFLRAWKAKKIRNSIIIGVISGIATGLMGLTWGGVTYVYITIGLSTLIAFILDKVKDKHAIAYSSWIISSLLILMTFTTRFSLLGFLLGTDTALATLALAGIIVDRVIWKTSLKEKIKIEKIKLPRTVITLIITIILALIIALIIDFSFITDKVSQLYNMLIKPITGRWSTTVAENRQPYFTEWFGSFGKALFWIFFVGSTWLFYNVLKNTEKKKRIIITLLYVLFFFGLVFSRYSSSSSFNGENLQSKLFYFGSTLLLIIGLVYFYIKDYKEGKNSFQKINYSYLLLYSLLILTLFTARSAIRLIMVLVPIVPIFLGYLVIELFDKWKTEKKENSIKVLYLILFILVIIVYLIAAFGTPIKNSGGFYQSIKQQAYYSIPGAYNIQWQRAMSWVRNNTPQEAIFAHWWDYGYWLQSIGDRATVTDGGNAITYWNYLIGRLVLTGDNQKEALDFLYSHGTDYLLIDSTDIGKYGAFSQIGSDYNYDRFSNGPITMLSDKSKIQETSNTIRRTYEGGGCVEDDIKFEANGSKVFIPGIVGEGNQGQSCNSYIGAVILDMVVEGEEIEFQQPIAAFVYQNKQINLPIRYIYFKGKLYDFGQGLNAAINIIQRVSSDGSRWGLDESGAVIYLSPRVLRGFLGQVYILDNGLKNFNNFELVHTESSLYIEMFRQNGLNLREFVYIDGYGGLNGPIKIWKINYKGNEEIKQEYLDKDATEYLSWEL